MTSSIAADLPSFPFRRPEPFGVPDRYDDLRSRQPVCPVRSADGKRALLVTGYEDVRAVLMDSRVSTDKNHPGYPLQNRFFGVGKVADEKTFFDMDPPEHTRFRRMFAPDFSGKAVERMLGSIQAVVDDCLDGMIAAGPPQDLVSSLSLALPTRALATVLGVPHEDFDFLQAKTTVLVSLRSGPEDAAAASKDLLAYFLELIGRKEAAPGQDLISRVLREHVAAGELTKVQLASSCRVLLVAGFETTASMISLSTLALVTHPEQRDHFVAADDAGAAAAVEELLRYLAVAHVGRRRVAIEDMEIGGQPVSAGEGLILATDAGDHDPRIVDDPGKLDLTRRRRKPIVAFGFGVHQCIGQSLARAELRIALRTLLRRLPELRLAMPVEQLPFEQEAMAYGAKCLPVVW